MKICVCVKHVPDTAASIKVVGDSGFEDSEIKFVSNPFLILMHPRDKWSLKNLKLCRKDPVQKCLRDLWTIR